MKRELKFRVWNGAEMVHDVTVGKFGTFYVNPTNNGLDPNDSASLTPFTTKYNDDTPVMQFTGLRDKNGKEIYEGDIIKADNSKHKCKVSWSEKYASFVLTREDWTFRHYFGEACDPEDCEVIGNIYSNPELLKP